MTLIESIYKEPEKWFIGEHYFTHKSGARLWIANGFFMCQPPGNGYVLIERWKAFRAYRWWVKNAKIEYFNLEK